MQQITKKPNSGFNIVELPISLKLTTSQMLCRTNHRTSLVKSGFTIVELLVVIVVIGILAAITIVSYTGISQRAKVVALQSDLSNASTQLKLFQATDADGNYPTANNCPTPGATEICLKASNGNTFTYTSNGKTFSLEETNTNGTVYNVTDSTSVAAGALPVTLTISAGANGTVNTAVSGSYSSGSTPTITATPSTNYAFSSWSGSTGCSGTASHIITMDGAKSCTANFTIITYILTITAGAGGTVNAGGTYNSGTSQTITATPNANYVFSSWSGSTGCSGTASHTITMDGTKSCTANFTITYTLTITAGANGIVNAGGTYNSGTAQTITATPNAIYAFSSWSGSTGCSGVASHTITMDANKSCTANFTLDANWLAIGSQIWAKANLNVGTMVTGATAQTNNSSLEKYCYSDTGSNCTTYGGLYQWNEAIQYVTTSGAQGICPTGSHIPTDAEWTTLETYLGSATAGTQLQPGGSSGLNMPFAGYRYTDGSFYDLPWGAYLWSSSESGANAWSRYLGSDSASVNHVANVKVYGFSVRCMGN